jgi:hypothetical protein
MLSFVFFASFFSLFSVANENSLYLPKEIVDSFKKEFNIGKKPQDLNIVVKPVTLLIRADKRSYEKILNGKNDSVDFADFGRKVKNFTLQLQAEKATESKHEAPEAKAEALEHGAPEEHGAPAEHGAPPAEHGGGHGGAADTKGPQKTLYFINRYKTVQSQGHSFGLPCGKVLKFQSQLDDLFTTQGIKVKGTGGRHLDAFGGDFLLARREGDDIFVSFFKLKDSRYADRLCKMSFE